MVALLEACDVKNNGHHLGRHLGFYQELEIRLKPQEMVFLYLTCKITQKYALCVILSTIFTFIVKEVENTCILTKIWLDYLLLMTSYPVTIVTDYY